MAVYSRTTGNSSSTTNTQTSNTTTTVKEPVASMELGQIIVRSLEVVSDAIESKDTPATNSEQLTKSVTEAIDKSNSITKADLEKAITEAIDKSNYAKTNINNSSRLSRLTDSKQSEEPKERESERLRQQYYTKRQEYWEQKKFEDEKKRKTRQERLENESRIRKEKNYTQHVEQVFKGLNAFSKNPLAGVVNTFENGIKKFFNKTMNTTFGDVGKHIKKGADIAFAPIKATGQILGTATKTVGKTAIATTGLVAKGIGGIAKGVGNVVLGGVAVGSLIKDKITANDNLAGSNLGGLIEDVPQNKPVQGKVVERENSIPNNIQTATGKPETNTETITKNDLQESIVTAIDNSKKSESERNLESLIQEDKKTETESNSELANLIQPDAKDSKKDRKEQKKEQVAQGKILKSIGKTTDMIKTLNLIKFGAIVGIIGGIAAFLPQIIGILTPFINNIPMYWEDLKIKMGMIFSGPNSIGTQIKLALMETIQKIGLSLQNSDDKLLKSLGAGMVSGVASGQQADLAEEFKQSQQYKTMIAQGVSEENMAKFLTAKDSSSLAVKFGEVEKERYSKDITYTDKKGKKKKIELRDIFLTKQDDVFQNERGMELSNKYKAVVTAVSSEDIEANKMTDKEWLEFQNYLWDAKLGTDAISDIQKIYNDKLATAEWLKVVETRESGKLITDFDTQREENKAKSVDLENQKKAAWRIQRAESEGFSILDFQTDKEWDINPYLKDLKDEMMSNYATELSKGEKVGIAAMQTTAAGKKLIGNLGANITGNSNSWQNAETKLETSMIVNTTGNESGALTHR